MNRDQIEELFDYSFWAFEILWSVVEQISDDQFTADLPYSHGSVRNIIVHLISSHRRWLARLTLAAVPPHLNFVAYPTRTSVRRGWDVARTEWRQYLDTLTEPVLAETVRYSIPSRTAQAETARWEILLHLVNHATDHRSQILALVSSAFGIATPEHDFILYLWETQKRPAAAPPL